MPAEVQPILDCFGEDHRAPSHDFIAKLVEHELFMREYVRKEREKIARMPSHLRAQALAELEKWLNPHGLDRHDP